MNNHSGNDAGYVPVVGYWWMNVLWIIIALLLVINHNQLLSIDCSILLMNIDVHQCILVSTNADHRTVVVFWIHGLAAQGPKGLAYGWYRMAGCDGLVGRLLGWLIRWFVGLFHGQVGWIAGYPCSWAGSSWATKINHCLPWYSPYQPFFTIMGCLLSTFMIYLNWNFVMTSVIILNRHDEAITSHSWWLILDCRLLYNY